MNINNKQINNMCFSKIEKVNELQLSTFLLNFEIKKYLVEWRKQKRTTPIEIQYF
jgi:hypothetical protein